MPGIEKPLKFTERGGAESGWLREWRTKRGGGKRVRVENKVKQRRASSAVRESHFKCVWECVCVSVCIENIMCVCLVPLFICVCVCACAWCQNER